MPKLRTILLLFILFLSISWLSSSGEWTKTQALYPHKEKPSRLPTMTTKKKMDEKAADARLFVKRKGYNDNICFLIDMSLPSRQPRFFIFDLKADSLVNKGLVAHGNCFEYWLDGRKYSNVVGSGCTSLGKYKIGYSYTGTWGYSYKLHGLDSTNNKAFDRTVVLHSHSCVPETEVADDICQSNGCPTVAPNFLNQLKTIVNTSRKPVLLWIYE